MMNKLTLFGCATLLLSSLIHADPFKTIEESRGKIETGYGEDDEAFMKHRTRYHLIGPVNWLNDPSSMYYDGEYYHVHYQHNPYDYVWGNMTWGHWRSKDLLKWEDRPFSLYPDIPDNQAGAFDGTALVDNGYQGLPTMIYTAVNSLDTPYRPGAEQQMLTVTRDNGDTWENIRLVIDKSDIPFNSPVGGFRDPFLFRSTTFDDLLNLKPNGEGGDEDDSIYMTLSSSIVGKGGRLWLYHSKNWIDWELRGPILAHPINHTSNPIYFGSDGDNFEVASYYELPDPAGGDNFHVLTYGSERGRDDHFKHWTLYTSGQELEIIKPDNVETAQDTPRFKETVTGVVDWGLLYAVLELDDSKNKRPLLLGWVQDDLLDPKNNPARWNGVMGLFRETFIQKVDHVSPNDPILEKGKNAWIYDEQSRSVRLMGTRPMKEYEQIRGAKWSLDCQSKSDFSDHKIPVDSKYVEIDATFKIQSKDSGALGIVVRQSDVEETVINYIPNQGNIYINRTLSTQSTKLYRVTPEVAPLPLFQINTPNSDHSQANTKYEDLHLRIFVDNSLLEVFANDRLAISTRIYPNPNSNGLSIRIPNDITVANFDVYNIDFAAFDRP